MSIIQIPPIAPGPFIPDAFAGAGDGHSFTWGISHVNPGSGSGMNDSNLVRFDRDLSLDVDRPSLERNNLRFNEPTYFQRRVRLPNSLRNTIERERATLDRDTIVGSSSGPVRGRGH